jgi:hypothetical protein
MIAGGLLLVLTLSWAPFLQARVATDGRIGPGFRLRETREIYSHAPLACSLATIVLYLLALPLYLFKAYLLPQDAMWFVTLVFIISIYPTRVLTGWAWYWAMRRKQEGRKAHYLWRWSCSAGVLVLLGIYVFILYFTQFLGEQGKLVLYQHHALLLPVPF